MVKSPINHQVPKNYFLIWSKFVCS
jgi:hypothetical protein